MHIRWISNKPGLVVQEGAELTPTSRGLHTQPGWEIPVPNLLKYDVDAPEMDFKSPSNYLDFKGDPKFFKNQDNQKDFAHQLDQAKVDAPADVSKLQWIEWKGR